MLALSSVETLKKRLKITHNDDDDDLELLVFAASARVVSHLDTAADELLDLDSSGELSSGSVVPPEVEAATLYLAGVMYRDPDGADGGAFQDGSLPAPVVAFLKPFREPPLA